MAIPLCPRPPLMTKTWTIGAKIMSAFPNHLYSRHSLRFPPTRMDAIISARMVPAAMGQGHNATTVQRVERCGSVVGFLPAKPKGYTFPTTPQRQKQPLSRMCTYARARVRDMRFYRCTVVPLYYHIDIYREKATTHPTTPPQRLAFSVVGGVVFSSNPLKSLEKGVF